MVIVIRQLTGKKSEKYCIVNTRAREIVGFAGSGPIFES